MEKKQPRAYLILVMEKKQPRAYLILVDGTIRDIDHKPTLSEAQQLIGGYVELFPRFYSIDKNMTIFGDEDGKLKRKPLNKKASELVSGVQLVGNILVLEGWRTLTSG